MKIYNADKTKWFRITKKSRVSDGKVFEFVGTEKIPVAEVKESGFLYGVINKYFEGVM